MITRKLAVPLINEKVLQQAEHCYIVTSSVSDAGFDFVRSRISPKCKIDLVTGLDRPVSPNVLRRILHNYSERISVKVYTRNTLNANLYLFELPFRKSVAYIGSGGLTMDGLKDQEEIFWKVTNPKEIESLLSWFTSFYEFGMPLTQQMVEAYEPVYAAIQRREVASRREKEFAVVSAGIAWDVIKFRNQYFQREEYALLNEGNAGAQRVQHRLRQLADESSDALKQKGIFLVSEIMDVNEAEDGFPTSVWISFSRSASGFSPGYARVDAGLTASWFFVRLYLAGGDDANDDRITLMRQLDEEAFRQKLFGAVSSLGSGYVVDVGGRRRGVETFARDTVLVEWLRSDESGRCPIVIERRFLPGDAKIRLDTIKSTVYEELIRLNAIAVMLTDA